MDANDVMNEWEVSPFEGGYDGLQKLQSRGFSGAVEAGTSWLFLARGDPLAVIKDIETAPREGDIDAFEDATGQIHEATHPSAVTLAAMLALEGDIRGKYFTDETPLSKVHETLSSGGFTGYVELSENVLSGDYYVLYEGGEESYLGVLGSSNRLITGEEAESKAEGEVGIYSVVAVQLPDIEIPSPEPEPSPAATSAVGDTETETDVDESESNASEESGTAAAAPIADADEKPVAAAEETPQTADEDRGVTESADRDDSSDDSTDAAPEETADSEPVPTAEAATDESESDADSAAETHAEADAQSPEKSPDSTADVPAEADSPDSETGPVPLDEAEDNSGNETKATASETVGADTEPGADEEGHQPAQSRDLTTGAVTVGGDTDEDTEQEQRIEELRSEHERRVEELQSELEAVRDERNRLQDRLEALESTDSPTESSSGLSLSAGEALAGTSLFVREGSRGEATIDDAYAGTADRDTLAGNLRIEYHTQFDDDGATVEGEPFDTWLRSTATYEFVEWLVIDLLFEIQSTAAESGMRHLYDALPAIDRIGFDDSITVGSGKEGRELTFDVVARNQMGEPLAVATIDGGRDPTYADSLEKLITDASDICAETESLSGAFVVTPSYFDPDALSTAREATSASLLSREKYRSYVKLARKNGYHLCLVESRDGSFHMTVPEL